MEDKTLTLQEDQGQYDYCPSHRIDATEHKLQFEDIKPLTSSYTPLQFRIDDQPYPFCPREMEFHIRIKFKVGSSKAPAYHSNTARLIVGPVNNFGYSCIHQVRCKVNNAETESASGVNLVYRQYFETLLESTPWDEIAKLKRQGWYRCPFGIAGSRLGSNASFQQQQREQEEKELKEKYKSRTTKSKKKKQFNHASTTWTERRSRSVCSTDGSVFSSALGNPSGQKRVG